MTPELRARLDLVRQRFERLTVEMADPGIAAQPAAYARLAREHAELSPVVEGYDRCRILADELEGNRSLLDDAELGPLARDEAVRLKAELEAAESRLTLLLLPRDPNEGRNVILEIRAGTGGHEAALFAGDMLRMYGRYAERRGWRVETLSLSPGEVGGFKEVICLVAGRDVYGSLRWEGGVHRVQRVPATEAQGRIHTSAVTVAVLTEAEEVEVEINPADLQIDVFRSGGPGGQSVNTTDSAVRVTHRPSGLVVICQDEKSQIKNKSKALKVLRARLLDRGREQQHQQISEERRSMVGSGDRSERIRTYNFPQGRLTDHRINLTLYRLSAILDGDLDEVTTALRTHHQALALKNLPS